jgi:hypothetical protein
MATEKTPAHKRTRPSKEEKNVNQSAITKRLKNLWKTVLFQKPGGVCEIKFGQTLASFRKLFFPLRIKVLSFLAMR